MIESSKKQAESGLVSGTRILIGKGIKIKDLHIVNLAASKKVAFYL